MANVLAVVSSGYKDRDYHTGWWGEELFAPLGALEKEGHVVDLASPLGGKPELDERSILPEYDPNGTYKALYESGRADDTQKISEINPENYEVVLIVGGHGAMFDLAKNDDLHRIINSVYDRGGIIAAECHGPSVLVYTTRPNGKSIIAGLKVTGYPDALEPEDVVPYLPYSLEQEMRKIAEYIPELDKKAFAVWGDSQIVTSRDPFSSELMGEELVKALQTR
ncbi:type 1 glutamine amidotransferase domain-containing protein [Alicyclobacillus sp. SO9]|uniref:type 1 glutamine amidotransferase domain-containing protein n=1 Tax=Alicyclobacillus sp. SO9 TaxID=2665646 RepID=UPI0018E8DB42|nr:type 1 glutamine amidotransferase domain-containing protein [Alicyclobacillus sp. SO9]QQE80415.1 type 1 glutamine amidotransferase domain-containing protein [Alicyclobacillus sp. SO9]